MTAAALPSTLVKCLYLFFDLPSDSTSTNPSNTSQVCQKCLAWQTFFFRHGHKIRIIVADKKESWFDNWSGLDFGFNNVSKSLREKIDVLEINRPWVVWGSHFRTFFLAFSSFVFRALEALPRHLFLTVIFWSARGKNLSTPSKITLSIHLSTYSPFLFSLSLSLSLSLSPSSFFLP